MGSWVRDCLKSQKRLWILDYWVVRLQDYGDFWTLTKCLWHSMAMSLWAGQGLNVVVLMRNVPYPDSCIWTMSQASVVVKGDYGTFRRRILAEGSKWSGELWGFVYSSPFLFVLILVYGWKWDHIISPCCCLVVHSCRCGLWNCKPVLP